MSQPATHKKAAFTLIEVMIAVGVLTMGSLGILGMYGAIMRSNRFSNEVSTATVITQTWIERIERDALSWTESGIASASLIDTNYLSELVNEGDESGWFRPDPTADPDNSYAFTFSGNDTTTNDDVKYCVNVNLSWVRQGESARADIRTFWLREGYSYGAPVSGDWVAATDFRTAQCDATAATTWDLDAAPNTNVIYASTVVRWQPRTALP